ncbi:hypothetical protein ACFT5C_27470 [Streptomyces sp. NPDC057116]|uniref:hypothetical protein n=1 Tax=Streptomyces sp. NPDC057116 TaxID=3346023 RepID=UPI003644BCFF
MRVVEQPLGDLLAAVEDGGDRCFPYEGGQAPDAAAGAVVEIGGVPGQRAPAVGFQAQRLVHALDQALPGCVLGGAAAFDGEAPTRRGATPILPTFP